MKRAWTFPTVAVTVAEIDFLAAIAASAGELCATVRQGLARARTPWPSVDRDARGLAVV